MHDTDLYHQILGLSSPWEVQNVELSPDDDCVLVYLGYPPDNQWHCPKCQQSSPIYDHREPRRWRHLDSCQFTTILIARLPRIQCGEHGVVTIEAPWSSPNSRFSNLFERQAIEVLTACKVQSQAARLLRISSDQVHHIMERSVLRGLARRDATAVHRHLSIDEKSFQKGHRYATVLSDPLRKCILDVGEGRDKESVTSLLKGSLTGKQRDQVESMSMDMWPAYMSCREELFPQADTVHDRFHISGYLNNAVDLTRRAEQSLMVKASDKRLARSKWLWLRAHDNLTPNQKTAFEMLRGLDFETAKVWAFKEGFSQFFSCHTNYGAKTFFDNWYETAMFLNSPFLTKVAETLKRHLPGLLAYIKHHVTNATAEGFNSQIQLIKANARGYRKFENFRIAILFFLGKLNLYPQETR